MRKLLEATTTGSSTSGGSYAKPLSTVIKRTISTKETQGNSCPCAKLHGNVICGICNSKRKQ